MESQFVYRNSDGVRRTFIVDDEHPDRLVTKTEVVMDGVIETNKIMRELQPQKSINKLVARGIPMTVYERSIHEQWDDKDWDKWLNDPDNAMFRVWEGRV